MRPLVVIKLPPFLDHDLRFAAGNEPFPVQAFVAQLAVEAFHKSVLSWAAQLDIGRSTILVAQPFHHRCGGKSRAAVGPNKRRLAIQRINRDSVKITS
jgi:hypothetical protein